MDLSSSLFQHPRLSRRTALQAGAIGLLGLGADHVAALQAAGRPNASHVPKARSVIYIFLSGGLSQIDSFDPKPDAPADIRGEFGAIATQTTGLRICEHLPLLAQRSRRRPSSSQETKFSPASCKCQVPSRLPPSKKSSVGMLRSNSQCIAAAFGAAECFFFLCGMDAALAHFLKQQSLNFLPLPQGQGSFRPILFGLVDSGIGRGDRFLARSASCLANSAASLFFSRSLSSI